MIYIAHTQEKSQNKLFHYLLGRQPSDGWLLMTDDDSALTVTIFLDSRYYDQRLLVPEQELQIRFGRPVSIEKVLLVGKVGDLLDKNIGPDQGDTLTVVGPVDYQIADKLQAKYSTIGFDPQRVDQQRIIKTPYEIAKIQQAIALTEAVFVWLVEHIDYFIGKTERAVRVALLEQAVQRGADREAFPAIVATGSHSALAHHASGDGLIGSGPLLIDMGYTVDGYCSDFTRTFRVGPESEQKKVFDEIVELVQAAQAQAVSMIHPGNASGTIDHAAREYITNQGYGEYFTHATGHGVGLNIHELPHVSPNIETLLEPGMVLTVEPGIYLPGKFGVRREDTIIVANA